MTPGKVGRRSSCTDEGHEAYLPSASRLLIHYKENKDWLLVFIQLICVEKNKTIIIVARIKCPGIKAVPYSMTVSGTSLHVCKHT